MATSLWVRFLSNFLSTKHVWAGVMFLFVYLHRSPVCHWRKSHNRVSFFIALPFVDANAGSSKGLLIFCEFFAGNKRPLLAIRAVRQGGCATCRVKGVSGDRQLNFLRGRSISHRNGKSRRTISRQGINWRCLCPDGQTFFLRLFFLWILMPSGQKRLKINL